MTEQLEKRAERFIANLSSKTWSGVADCICESFQQMQYQITKINYEIKKLINNEKNSIQKSAAKHKIIQVQIDQIKSQSKNWFTKIQGNYEDLLMKSQADFNQILVKMTLTSEQVLNMKHQIYSVIQRIQEQNQPQIKTSYSSYIKNSNFSPNNNKTSMVVYSSKQLSDFQKFDQHENSFENNPRLYNGGLNGNNRQQINESFESTPANAIQPLLKREFDYNNTINSPGKRANSASRSTNKFQLFKNQQISSKYQCKEGDIFYENTRDSSNNAIQKLKFNKYQSRRLTSEQLEKRRLDNRQKPQITVFGERVKNREINSVQDSLNHFFGASENFLKSLGTENTNQFSNSKRFLEYDDIIQMETKENEELDAQYQLNQSPQAFSQKEEINNCNRILKSEGDVNKSNIDSKKNSILCDETISNQFSRPYSSSYVQNQQIKREIKTRGGERYNYNYHHNLSCDLQYDQGVQNQTRNYQKNDNPKLSILNLQFSQSHSSSDHMIKEPLVTDPNVKISHNSLTQQLQSKKKMQTRGVVTNAKSGPKSSYPNRTPQQMPFS